MVVWNSNYLRTSSEQERRLQWVERQVEQEILPQARLRITLLEREVAELKRQDGE